MPDIDITRVYAVPRERLWRAWTRPDEIAAWWGRRGWSTPVDSVTLDVRPGGIFRLNSVNDEDGREMPLDAVYVEVVEPERIVFAREGDLRAVVTFTDLGDDRTEMSFVTSMRATAEVRDGATVGLQSAFDRLSEHLHDPRSTP